MAFADSNRVSLRRIEESVWGTTPGTGSARELRITSSSLTPSKETVVSDELRADRMVGSITEVAASVEGDIGFEFSAGTIDEFLAAFVMGSWTRPIEFDSFRGISVSITGATTVTITGGDYTAIFPAGRRFKLDGFADPANIGYFAVTSVGFAGGVTTITSTGAGLVTEAGTSTARIFDANDVIVLNDTTISTTASGISSTGTPFATAIAAGQLVVGQKVFLTGLGYATGTLTVAAALTNLVVRINDGVASFDLTAGTDFAVGGTATADALALTNAINRARTQTGVRVKATAAAGVITVTNMRGAGGTMTEVVDDAQMTVVNFSGGNAGVNKVYTITSVAGNLLGVSPLPPVLAAGAKVCVKGSLLRNPSNVASIAQRKFTIETGFNDVNQFLVMDGLVPGSISLDLAAGEIVTGSIGFQGRGTAIRSTTLIGTAPYVQLPSQSTEVMNATTNVGTIEKDGVALATAIQSLSISGDGGLRTQSALGSKFARGIGQGRFNLTGSISAYFETATLFNEFLTHDTVSLSFRLTDLDSNSYVITIPAVKFTTDTMNPSGIDTDVMEEIEWTAFRDASLGCMVQFDRYSATNPV